MADAYIDQTYVRQHMGTNLETAIFAITGTDLTQQIEAATSKVQAAMRNSGYTPPTTTDPTEVEEVVKLAVLGCFINQVHAIPEVSIPLPEGWNEAATWGPGWLVTGIWNGDVKLAADPSDAGAVGGWQASEHRSSVTDAFTQRASRKELEGF